MKTWSVVDLPGIKPPWYSPIALLAIYDYFIFDKMHILVNKSYKQKKIGSYSASISDKTYKNIIYNIKRLIWEVGECKANVYELCKL